MIRQIRAHSEGVSSVRCNSHGTVLCTTSSDQSAVLWDLRSFEGVCSLKGHKDTVNNSMFVGETHVVTCSDDKTVCVWDCRNVAAPAIVLGGFRDGVNQTLSHTLHDGRPCIISGADDGLVYVHSASDGALIDQFWVATNTVNDIALDPVNSNILITCSEDCSVRTWYLEHAGTAAGGPPPDDEMEGNDRLIASFDEFENPVNHLALRGNWIYTACAECVFSAEYITGSGTFGESAKAYSCHSDYVRGIEFFGDGMYTVSDDTTMIEWNIDTCEPKRQLKIHDEYSMALTSTCALVDGSERTLITGSEGGVVRLWALPLATEAFA